MNYTHGLIVTITALALKDVMPHEAPGPSSRIMPRSNLIDRLR